MRRLLNVILFCFVWMPSMVCAQMSVTESGIKMTVWNEDIQTIYQGTSCFVFTEIKNVGQEPLWIQPPRLLSNFKVYLRDANTKELALTSYLWNILHEGYPNPSTTGKPKEPIQPGESFHSLDNIFGVDGHINYVPPGDYEVVVRYDFDPKEHLPTSHIQLVFPLKIVAPKMEVLEEYQAYISAIDYSKKADPYYISHPRSIETFIQEHPASIYKTYAYGYLSAKVYYKRLDAVSLEDRRKVLDGFFSPTYNFSQLKNGLCYAHYLLYTIPYYHEGDKGLAEVNQILKGLSTYPASLSSYIIKSLEKRYPPNSLINYAQLQLDAEK